MFRWVRQFVHNDTDGSWFGFPNPRYMSRSVFIEELGFWLFMTGTTFIALMAVMLFVSFLTPLLMVSLWPVAVALVFGAIGTVLNMIGLFLPVLSKWNGIRDNSIEVGGEESR